MIAAFRMGLGSWVEGLVARWRARVRPRPRSARAQVSETDVQTAESGSHETILSPEAALRRYLAFALDDTPPEQLDDAPARDARPLIAAVSRTLENLEARPELIPRRPSLLPKLLRAVNDGDTSLRQIAIIVGQDAALTGNLLRVANSPYYRVTRKTIDSLDRAVTMVGTEGIRSIITTALVQPVLTAGSGAFARFPEIVWEHTLYASTAAETRARNVESVDPFPAQLLALVHGLATNVVFRVVRDLQAAHAVVNPAPAVAFLLDRWVDVTALRIASCWELPEAVQNTFEARALAEDLPLARALQFGRVAGALLVLAREERISTAQARATVLADEARRAQVSRVWDRLAGAYLH